MSVLGRVVYCFRARSYRLGATIVYDLVRPSVKTWVVFLCPTVRAGVCGTVRRRAMRPRARLAESEWPGGDRTRVVRTKMHVVRTKIVKRKKSPFWPVMRSPAQASPSLEGSGGTGVCRYVCKLRASDPGQNLHDLYRSVPSHVPIHRFKKVIIAAAKRLRAAQQGDVARANFAFACPCKIRTLR